MNTSSIESVLDNLSKLYHPLFVKLCDEKLQPGEQVLFAADVSFKPSPSHHNYIGFIVITSHRLFDVMFFVSNDHGSDREKILFHREGGGFLMHSDDYYWFPNLEKPLTAKELQSVQIQEARLSEIKTLWHREWSLKHKSETLDFFVFRMFNITSMKKADGLHAYELMQRAASNGGTVLAEANNENFLSELERLARLHNEKKLTDEEFALAKKKILEK